MEQKVWVTTSAPLYPNLYVFLVGHPGVGKSRTITAAVKFFRELPDAHVSPTSMTMASMVDALVQAKRLIMRQNAEALDYNSMFVVADELSAFMHKFDEEIIGGLTTFYDVSVPYAQNRRGNDIRIKIKHPQLSVLSGTTPSNLMRFMPENAWDQGFTSRVIMVFSDERLITDIFANESRSLPDGMLHDIRSINAVQGEYKATSDYKSAIHNWRKLGQPPTPSHPKLVHYCTRRLAHLLKLSMIAAIDRSNELLLTKEDFNRAMGWLLEAEETMPSIFQAGAVGGDGKAMDEIRDYVLMAGKAGMLEQKIINFAKDRIPANSVLRVMELMEKSGMITAVRLDKSTGLRVFAARLDSPQSQTSDIQDGIGDLSAL